MAQPIDLVETCLSEADETALRGRESCVQFLVDQYPSLLTPDLTMMQLRMMGLPFFRSATQRGSQESCDPRKHSKEKPHPLPEFIQLTITYSTLCLLMSLVIATANCKHQQVQKEICIFKNLVKLNMVKVHCPLAPTLAFSK